MFVQHLQYAWYVYKIIAYKMKNRIVISQNLFETKPPLCGPLIHSCILECFLISKIYPTETKTNLTLIFKQEI